MWAGTEEYSKVCDGDTCRELFVQGECSAALATQLLSYLLIKPAYEIPLQLLLPRAQAWWEARQRERRIAQA